MRVRIVGSGSAFNTSIYDADTGEPIKGVEKVEICLTATKLTAKLYMIDRKPVVDLVVDAEVISATPPCDALAMEERPIIAQPGEMVARSVTKVLGSGAFDRALAKRYGR